MAEVHGQDGHATSGRPHDTPYAATDLHDMEEGLTLVVCNGLNYKSLPGLSHGSLDGTAVATY